MPTETLTGNDNNVVVTTAGRTNFRGFIYSGGGGGESGVNGGSGGGGGAYCEFVISDLSVLLVGDTISDINLVVDDLGNVSVVSFDTGSGLIVPAGSDGSDGGLGSSDNTNDVFGWTTLFNSGGDGGASESGNGGGGGGCGSPTAVGHNAVLDAGGAAGTSSAGAGGNGATGTAAQNGHSYGGGGGGGGSDGNPFIDGASPGVGFISISYDIVATGGGAACQLLLAAKII